jgi:hypothetical protein
MASPPLRALAQRCADLVAAEEFQRETAVDDIEKELRGHPAIADAATVQLLLRLILVDMAAATNADLAADGPVGDDEGRVWREIEAAAKLLQSQLREEDDPDAARERHYQDVKALAVEVITWLWANDLTRNIGSGARTALASAFAAEQTRP